MQIIREFFYEFKEASHDKIGIKLLKLWNLEVQFWVPIPKTCILSWNRVIVA